MGQYANQFSTEVILTGTGASASIAFGLTAQAIRVRSYAAVPIRINMLSTSAASSGDPDLEPHGTLRIDGLRIDGLGLGTTSTTSSTGADGHRVVVSAWGGY